MIQYDLKLKSPQAHIVEVTMSLTHEAQTPLRLTMPAWVPGSYTIRDFSKNIVGIKAWAFDSKQRTLSIQKVDSHTYEVESVQGQVHIQYDVYCWDRSVRGAHFDLTHGFFNGSCIFLCAQSLKQSPVLVKLNQPESTYQNLPWIVATTMPVKEIDEQGFGTYEAPNYEALIDYPIEMGQFESIGFDVKNIPHQVAITGWQTFDHQRLQKDVQKICTGFAELFDGLPFEQYLFLLTIMEDGYGGLEHSDSTALMCFKKCMPSKHMKDTTKEYRQLLGLFSHEYFHVWNVKRIKPLEFHNMDLSKAQHTTQLWAFEGITSYYDDYMLLRSGVISIEHYLEGLAELISRVYQGSGRLKQTLKESSFDAWTKFYHPDENSPNSLVSYYAKGAICAMAFDLMIRQKSHGSKSLDDVMRHLWQNYGQKNQGVPEGIIENLIVELGGDELKPLVHQALNTTDDLPLEDIFKTFGVSLSWDYPKGTKEASCNTPVSLEIRYSGSDKIKITHVLDDGCAQLAGLCAGDELIAIDNCQVKTSNLSTVLNRLAPGDTVNAHVFREERLLEFAITLGEAPKNEAKLTLMDIHEGEVKVLREGWLGG